MGTYIRRSLPFFHSLVKMKSNRERINSLKTFPDYVIHDIIEILYNIVHNNCPLSYTYKRCLRQNRRKVENLLNSSLKNRRKLKKVVLEQKGGFLGTLIPIVLSVLNSLL